MHAGSLSSSKSTRSTDFPEEDKLRLGNFRKWREDIRHIALDFGLAGVGLRSGIWPTLRQPQRLDLRLIIEPMVLPIDYKPIITEQRWDELLIPLLYLAVDADDEANIVRDLENLYERVFRDDDELYEARKAWRSDVLALRDATPKLLKAVVDTISKDGLEALKANPVYTVAYDAMDILGVMTQAEVTLGMQGTFSLVAVETAYDKLTQAGPPSLNWSAYSNRDADLRAQLSALGHAVPQHSATIRYLTRLKSWPGEWDAKVAALLGRIPLPSVPQCVLELQAQLQLMRAIQAARGVPRDVARAMPEPPAVKSDTPVMMFTRGDKGDKAKGSDKGDKKKPTCWNCGKLGHSSRDCRGKEGTCTTCGKHGHLAEFHENFEKFQQNKSDRKGKKMSSHANAATIDADDDDNNFMSWAYMFYIDYGDDVESVEADEDDANDWELVEVNPTSPPTGIPTSVPSGLDDVPPGSSGSTVTRGDMVSLGVAGTHHEWSSGPGIPTSPPTGKPTVDPTVQHHEVESDDYDDMPDMIDSDDESEDDDSYDGDDDVHTMPARASTPKLPRHLAAGDTGAEDHVVLESALLYDIKALARPISLVGVGGHRTQIAQSGILYAMPGASALLLECDDPTAVNLLSLGKIADSGNYFVGDSQSMVVRRESDDIIILEGSRVPPGFWAFDISPTETSTAAMPAQLEVFKHLTREQIERAKATRKLHVAMAHPSDDVLGRMLDDGVIVGCPYTSADVRNAAQCLGKCLACVAGKYKEAPAPTSMSPPAENIGDNVHCDLIPYSCTTIGGYTYGLIMMDEKCGFAHIEGLVRKTSKRIAAAVIKAKDLYLRYGHTIKRITPDAEANFIGATDALGRSQILVTPTIPGRKSKRVERLIQTAKDRIGTLDASLGFVVPQMLVGEKWNYVLAHISAVPCTNQPGSSPYSQFTGAKLEWNGWIRVPWARIAQFNTVPATGQATSAPVFGMTLGGKWTTVTSNAVVGYVPESNSVVVRDARNVSYTKYNNPPDAWSWQKQVAAPSYSTEHGTYKVLSEDDKERLLAAEKQSAQTESGIAQEDATSPPTVVPTAAVASPIADVEPSVAANHASGEDDIDDDDDTPSLCGSDIDEDDDTDYVPTSQAWQRSLYDKDELTAFVVTHEQALKGEHSADADPAVSDELDNMADNNVWVATDYHKLSKEDLAAAIPSGLYIKYNPIDGNYTKSKARLHAGGNK